MPEVTVRELITLVTGFHPRPLPVGQTLKQAGIASFAAGGLAQAVRRPDPAGPVPRWRSWAKAT